MENAIFNELLLTECHFCLENYLSILIGIFIAIIKELCYHFFKRRGSCYN